MIFRGPSIEAYLSRRSKDPHHPSISYPSRQTTIYKHLLTVWPSQARRTADLVKLTGLTRTSFTS
ncbi:hypothetical protein HanRHA438_Chr01g0020591 [Helianthus annuus]|nr:hypothetical protein HanRHA438_Chr01g0020591 [Helianthus annuus]